MAEPRPALPPPAAELALFPLDTVLFPEGLIDLKIFEARYLDMISDCLRTGAPFGIVGLTDGSEVRRAPGDEIGFEEIGTQAKVDLANADRPGLLRIACRGLERFRIVSSRQRTDGLWLGRITPISPDPKRAPPASAAGSVRALATTIATLKGQLGPDGPRFPSPYRFDDAGWVANRWAELLPLATPVKQTLLVLDDPVVRLERVDRFLRRQGVVDTDGSSGA